jgi:hypothetical protein
VKDAYKPIKRVLVESNAIEIIISDRGTIQATKGYKELNNGDWCS